MTAEYLEWDSAFFHRKIFKIEIESGFGMAELSRVVADTQGDVFYLFSDEKIELTGIAGVEVRELGGRVEFEKKIEGASGESTYRIVEANSPSEELYELAEASGRYSRFFLDPGFVSDAGRMYRCWLDKAFQAPGYALLTALNGNDEVIGLNLYSTHAERGRIELLAVRDEFRQKGVASSLVCAAEQKIRCMRVATQLQNSGACGFYRARGYQVLNSTYIWHLWKNQRK